MTLEARRLATTVHVMQHAKNVLRDRVELAVPDDPEESGGGTAHGRD